jgi:hypothetical protein
MARLAQVADHVERPDLAASLGREWKPVANVQDVHAFAIIDSNSAI